MPLPGIFSDHNRHCERELLVQGVSDGQAEGPASRPSKPSRMVNEDLEAQCLLKGTENVNYTSYVLRCHSAISEVNDHQIHMRISEKYLS